MFNQRQGANYGKGSHSIQASDLELDLSKSLAERIQAKLAAPTYQPPALPIVATKLIELSRAPDVDFRQVCTLLEQDPMLTGKVLARAQSAMYAGASPTRTLHDALVRLGLSTIRNLVLEMAFNVTVFRAPGYERPMQALRTHSLAVAYAARLVARHTSVDAEYAFLCGLLHDVGISAALILIGAEPAEKRPPLADLWPALAWIHEDLSGQIAKLWKLPAEVQLVVEQHHRIRSEGFAHPAIAALRVAEGLAEEIGAGLTSPEVANGFALETPSQAELDDAAKVLNLAPALRAKLLAELVAIKPQLSA